MTAPQTAAPDPPPELARLKRRFMILMILTFALTAIAVMFAVAHYAFHKAWGLPGFALALGAAFVVQIRFVWMFRPGRG
jgi:hypothetical protein